MQKVLRGAVVMAVALLGLLNAGAAGALEQMAVTVRQLFDQGHRLEIAAGTEVVLGRPALQPRLAQARPGQPDDRTHTRRVPGHVHKARDLSWRVHGRGRTRNE